MKLLVSISNPADYSFFKRFYSELDRRDWEISYFANNMIIYLLLKAKMERVYIARKVSGEYDRDLRFVENFSVLTRRLSVEEAACAHNSVIAKISNVYQSYKFDICIIPSGRLVNHVALAKFCNDNNIRTLFVGYGNIPERTFVDPKGTDMASMLYAQPGLLSNSDSSSSYSEWREHYLNDKFKAHKIGQARKVDFKLKLQKSIQIFSCYVERFLSLVGENSYYFGVGQKVKPLELEYNDLLPAEYIFFPMQVSTDAQIVLNYDGGDIYDALKEVLDHAKKMSFPLVVKPHPAEIDVLVFEKLKALQRRGEIYLRNDNTFSLIRDAQEVWTINSTVGLESMIVGTPVKFFGNSFYKVLNDKTLATYIMAYLVKIEYFSNKTITYEQFEDFFSNK
jgi:hypothetical protein